MNKLVLSVSLLMAFSSLSGLSADLVFENKDGSNDISSKAAWGVDDFSDYRAEFNTANAVLTASNDVSFAGGIKLTNPWQSWGGHPTMTFDMRDVTTGANPGPRKITLGGNLYFPGHNLTAIFRGGLWDCGNKTFLYSDIYKAPSNVVHVTDGAVLANLASFSGGSYGDRTGGDAYVYVDGASCVYTKVASLSRYGGKGGIMSISGGSKLVASNSGGVALALDEGGSCRDQTFVADGEGTEVCVTGTVYVSRAAWNNKMLVRNGASLSVDGIFALNYSSGSSNALLRVERGGTFEQSGTFYCGQSGPLAHVEVLDGGVMSSGQIRLGGTSDAKNCGLLVSNATYRGKFPMIGIAAGSTGCSVRLKGRQTVFDIQEEGKCGLFGVAPGGLISLDGACWTNNAIGTTTDFNAVYEKVVSKCRFELLNGAEYVATNAFKVGSTSYEAHTNVVFVGGGCLFSASSIRVASAGNEFVVSNGTVRSSAGSFVVCDDTDWTVNTNDCLVLQGDCPRVDVKTELVVKHGSRVRFELPDSGYASGVVPVSATTITFDESSRIEIANAVRYSKALPIRQDVVLLSASKKMTISPDRIAELNSDPEIVSAGAKVRLSSDGKSVLLRAGESGLVLTVR